MARSLSWIDATEWDALLGDVQPRHERDGAGMDGLGDSLRKFEPRRPARSAQTARPAVRPPEELREPARAAPVARQRPLQDAPARPAAPIRKPIAQAAPPASAPSRPAVAPRPAPAVEPARAVQVVEPFQPPAGTEALQCLDAYLEWATDQVKLTGAVIADANGLAVAERRTGEIDAAVSGSIDMLLHHLGTVLASDTGAGTNNIDGYVALQHNGRHIIVIWAPTDYGRLYGVLVGETAPAPEALAAAAETLRSLFAS